MSIAYPLVSTEGGIYKWDLSKQSGLQGPTYDSNGVQLSYIVTQDSFYYNAVGTDGKTYQARLAYFSDLTYEEMHGDSDEEPFLNKTNVTLISLLALVIIVTSGIIIAYYVRF